MKLNLGSSEPNKKRSPEKESEATTLHFVYSKKYSKNILNYPSQQQQQQEKQTKEERQREQQQKQQKEEGETEPRSIQFPYITTIRSNG